MTSFGKGMGGHQSSKMLNDEWLTPVELIRKLGDFDLDPCSPITPPWRTATTMLNKLDDGLSAEWEGRVWLNPPYGKMAEKWLEKLADHGNGIALIFARTETSAFFSQVWGRADALLFLAGRLHFHHVDGTRARANSGAPSVLVAYGTHNVEVLRQVSSMGQYINLERDRL